MKRKRILICIAACICLLAILFSVFWFVPVLRYEIFGISLKTDDFLPSPDVAKGFYAGMEATLSEAQGAEISQALAALAPKALTCEPMTGGLRWIDAKSGELLCLLFQYQRPYRYTGDSEKLAAINSWEFDALGMMIAGNEILVIKFTDSENEQEETRISLSFSKNDMDEFKRIVSKMVAQGITNPMGVQRESNAQWPATETENLFHEPDTVVVKNAEQSTKLSTEQKNQVYSSLSVMKNMQALPITGPYGGREVYTPKAVYADMESNPCVEFRYDKSYRFEGVFAQILSENTEKEPQNMELAVEFDSIVLILYESGAMVVFGQAGLYESAISVYRQFDFGPGYAAFRAEVLSLIA